MGLFYEPIGSSAGKPRDKAAEEAKEATEKKKKEEPVVVRIDMDGTVTRFVTAPGGGHEAPVGQRPVGARNIR